MEIKVRDGIINPKVFRNERKKLLWILKEPNDQQSHEDWDMRTFLGLRSEEQEGLFGVDHWRASFGLVCKISWGILEPSKGYSEINNLEKEELTKALDRIALINIKKIVGGPVTYSREFNNYLKDGKAIKKVWNQIYKIKPDIIICGNTFQYLKIDLKNFDYYKDWIYLDNNVIWINGYHPNAKINHQKYYNDVQMELRNYSGKSLKE